MQFLTTQPPPLGAHQACYDTRVILTLAPPIPTPKENVVVHTISHMTGGEGQREREKFVEKEESVERDEEKSEGVQREGKWTADACVVVSKANIFVRLDKALVPFEGEDGKLNHLEEQSHVSIASTAPTTGSAIQLLQDIFTSHLHIGDHQTIDTDLAHHEQEPGSFPIYLEGKPVKQIIIPLSSVYPSYNIKLHRENARNKASAVLSVPVVGHFPRKVKVPTGYEVWASGGRIEFVFPSGSNIVDGKATSRDLKTEVKVNSKAVHSEW